MYVCAKLLQLCPALCDPMDCSPLGSSVYGILQARILAWVAIPFFLKLLSSETAVAEKIFIIFNPMDDSVYLSWLLWPFFLRVFLFPFFFYSGLLHFCRFLFLCFFKFPVSFNLFYQPLCLSPDIYSFDWFHLGHQLLPAVCMCVSLLVVSDSLRPHSLQPTRLLCLPDFPGKDTRVGCYFLLQGIFPTQGLNPGLLHCRQILYWLSYPN